MAAMINLLQGWGRRGDSSRIQMYRGGMAAGLIQRKKKDRAPRYAES
jgi:hypothetical protein